MVSYLSVTCPNQLRNIVPDVSLHLALRRCHHRLRLVRGRGRALRSQNGAHQTHAHTHTYGRCLERRLQQQQQSASYTHDTRTDDRSVIIPFHATTSDTIIYHLLNSPVDRPRFAPACSGLCGWSSAHWPHSRRDVRTRAPLRRPPDS